MERIHLLSPEYNKRNFLHRPSLQQLNSRIKSEISNASKGTVFFYDMSEVDGINVSGVDEIIVKVVLWMRDNAKTHDKYLFLDSLNLEYDHEYNIGSSLEGLKDCIMARKGADHLLLGHLGKVLKEVLDIVYEKKKISARHLSDEYGKKLNLASTQLSELYNLRLIARDEVLLEEGGRQYIYRSLF